MGEERGAQAARARALAVLRVRGRALGVALLPAAVAVVLLAGGVTGRLTGAGWDAARWAVSVLAVAVLAVGAVVVSAVARARPALTPTVDIPAESAPDLYRLVEDLAGRLGVPAPSAIALTPDCDSWLEDRSHPAHARARSGASARGRRSEAAPVLVIGSPFLWWMRVAELRAVLAPVVAGTGPSAHPDIADARRFIRGLDAAVAAADRPGSGGGGVRRWGARFTGAVARILLRSCRAHAAEMERGVAAAGSERAREVDYGLRIAAQEQVGLAYAGWDRLLTRVALPAWRMGRWPSRLDAGVVSALTELSRRDRLAEGYASRLGERPACDLLEEPGLVDEATSLLAARLFHGGPARPGPGWAPVDWQDYPDEVVDRKWRTEAARLHRVLDRLGVERGTDGTLARVMDHLSAGTGRGGEALAAAITAEVARERVEVRAGLAAESATEAGGPVASVAAEGGSYSASATAVSGPAAQAAAPGGPSAGSAAAAGGPYAGSATAAGEPGTLGQAVSGPGTPGQVASGPGTPVAAADGPLGGSAAAAGEPARPAAAADGPSSAPAATPGDPVAGSAAAAAAGGPYAAPGVPAEEHAAPTTAAAGGPAAQGQAVSGPIAPASAPGGPLGGSAAAANGAYSAPEALAGEHAATGGPDGTAADGSRSGSDPTARSEGPVAPGPASASVAAHHSGRSASAAAQHPVRHASAATRLSEPPATAAPTAERHSPGRLHDTTPADQTDVSAGRLHDTAPANRTDVSADRTDAPTGHPPATANRPSRAGSATPASTEAYSADADHPPTETGPAPSHAYPTSGADSDLAPGHDPASDLHGDLPLLPLQPPRTGRELLADHVTAMVCCAAVDTAGAAPGLDWLDGPSLLIAGRRHPDLAARVLSLVEDADPGPLRAWLATVGVQAEKPVRLG
ncbi:hypothetical protein [Streptomyces lichenis]|uniref:Integral membrane protein n=1 Tax=Streptomyces lichenis TaxID=2306967 RepID=A0ABT0I531_9ACTN|nr:hypothetical protein [Streptomyces lichenis]MCK8676448.1 hypothetical protein [Streptomyces lichenis]